MEYHLVVGTSVALRRRNALQVMQLYGCLLGPRGLGGSSNDGGIACEVSTINDKVTFNVACH